MSSTEWCSQGPGSSVRVTERAGVLTCHCVLRGAHTVDEEKMLAHLLLHREWGDQVPDSVIERLQSEIAARDSYQVTE